MFEVLLNTPGNFIPVEKANPNKWYVLVASERSYIAFYFYPKWAFFSVLHPMIYWNTNNSLVGLLRESLSLKNGSKVFEFGTFKEASEFANNVKFD